MTADQKSIPEWEWVELSLAGSLIRRTERQRATVRGLGLRKRGSRSRLRWSPEVQGMIDRVGFMLKVKYS